MTHDTNLSGRSARDPEPETVEADLDRHESLFKNDLLSIAMMAPFLAALAGGCATRPDYVLPEEARQLTADEISNAFSNVRGDFESIHDAPLTATTFYIADGTFRASWEKGWFFDGSVEGKWYTEDDQLCVKTTTKVDGSDLSCVTVHELDGVYTTVKPDGSYQGIYTLTPMGEVMSSEQLRETWIGNTIYASYPDDGEMIDVWEYHDDDGTVYGRDGKHGEYRSTWDISDGGCFLGDYDNDKYDGCYFYVHDSGNRYRYYRPWTDEVGQGVLLEGNPEGLDGKSDS